MSGELDETSEKLLGRIADPNCEHDETSLIHYIGLHPEQVKHHLDHLEKGSYVYVVRTNIVIPSPTTYYLAPKGRDYLIQRGMI